jgi:hypothetical protein
MLEAFTEYLRNGGDSLGAVSASSDDRRMAVSGSPVDIPRFRLWCYRTRKISRESDATEAVITAFSNGFNLERLRRAALSCRLS